MFLKQELDNGTPCGLLNMEFQLIKGYDDTGFVLAQPWSPDVPVTPGRLEFSTWKEFGGEVHVNFYTFESCDAADRLDAIKAGLGFAIGLANQPDDYTSGSYGAGQKAYANWVDAVEAGHGGAHGNWWNATVWSECRKRAGEFFAGIAAGFPEVAKRAEKLSAHYQSISQMLSQAADKQMAADEKKSLIAEAGKLEKKSVGDITALYEAL